MKCQESECTGTILDGYCDVCGMASCEVSLPHEEMQPVSAPLKRAPAKAKPVAPQPGGACQQPDCSGTVIDGYCDTCGAPDGSAPLRDAPDLAALEAQAQQVATRSSNKLETTAIGTARVSSADGTKRRAVRRIRTAHLGEGLTAVPPAPMIDPDTAIMKEASVPENKRNCPQCEQPVGRSRDGAEGRLEGFCPTCGAKYSFSPKLRPGDLVANQYEVVGALAHGGMGWIYLARDRNVSNRHVVLKGILNSEDKDLLESALAEQQFLAQVQHPLIVEIYNTVKHEGSGYIVMEFVPGISLKQLLKQRMEANGGAYNPLPVDHAISFIVGILPAFAYLHDQGLVYNDFKPDNLMQIDDGVKLIDLGGVRSIDDEDSTLYGTVGYQAPEIAIAGPSEASDIYTIGRTLLVLAAEFRGYQTTYQYSIPSPAELPLLAQHDSLYRLLLKCCAPDPNDRFTSFQELGVQLMGVLREVVAAKVAGIAQTSTQSLLFTPPTVASEDKFWRQLPNLALDPADAQTAWVSGLRDLPPVERLRVLRTATTPTAEVDLATAAALLETGAHEELAQVVNDMLAADPWEWRAVWFQGLSALARADWTTAQSAFNTVYGQVPGELAPKLALAVACERGRELDVAETLYAICASTDANYVTPAGFGLARIRIARGNLAGAIAALDMIPSVSRGWNESRRLKLEHLVNHGAGLADLAAADQLLEQARMEPEQTARYRVGIFSRALAEVESRGENKDITIGGYTAIASRLRPALGKAYAVLAKHVSDPTERAWLVDQANHNRKWSLL